MRIYKEFFFEAAHFLPSAPSGHPNARVHGHSFRARITVDGQPDEDTGIVLHFDELEAAVADARDALDHRMLNEIEGLENPTAENIARVIFDAAKDAGLPVAEVRLWETPSSCAGYRCDES